MSNHKIDIIISNVAFALAVLMLIGSMLISLGGDDFATKYPLIQMSNLVAGFVGIPSMLLINAVFSLSPACAGLWSMLKGIVSFVYIAVFVPGAGRILESEFGKDSIRLDIVVFTYHGITLAVLILPLIGLVRKRKSNHAKT